MSCCIVFLFLINGFEQNTHTQSKRKAVGQGVEAAYRSDLEASDDPEALLAEITDRLNQVRSPFRTAEAFLVEEIIDPRDTRPLLCEFANLSAPLRTPGPAAVAYRP